MRRNRGGWMIASALGTAAGVTSALVYLRYQRETKAATSRLRADSQIIETRCGPVEYATAGDGSPILVAHGGGGGYDQALLMSPWLGLSDKFRWIAVSRFGYLRTPLPANASPAAQADAYAALLDALNLPQVTVVGGSAGGPSALQFALWYPDRCAALVLVSPVSRAWSPVPFGALRLMQYSGLVFWAMITFAPQVVLSVLGVTGQNLVQLASEERAWLQAVLQTILPLALRRAGMLNDMIQLANMERYPLDHITVPTLVIHAVDDRLVPFADGQFAAEAIPGARLLTLNTGGHLLVGHRDELASAVTAFVPA